MTTIFHNLIPLHEPEGLDRIDDATLAYAGQTAREMVFHEIHQKLQSRELTRRTIARRLGKSPARISQQLGEPGNFTIETLAELAYAIDGSFIRVEFYDPRQQTVNDKQKSSASRLKVGG